MLSNYPKGNPLLQNTNLVKDLRKNFRENSEIGFWEIKLNFKIWTSEYRVIKVYKISSLIQFLQALANVFLIEKEILSSNFKNNSKEESKKIIKEKLKSSVFIGTIAEFLNSNEDDTIDGILCSIPDSWFIKLHSVLSCGTILSCIYSFFHPFVGVPCSAFLNCLSTASTKSYLQKERITNISNVLNSIISNIVHYREQISNSNVLILAIDERNFNSYLLYNSFRRNDSGWCNFTYIDDLYAAPKAKDCNDWKQINEYLDIISIITSNKSVNIQEIRGRINSLTI